MNYLVDEFVFDLQLFAAEGFDPWADFDADETSEDVEPEVPEGTEEVSPDDIVSPEDAGADDFVYDADSADEETSSLLEELLNSDGVKDLEIDKSKCKRVEILDADGNGTGEYYYVITVEAIAAAKVDGEATIGGVQFNSSGSIVVNFGGDKDTGYTGVPTSFSAGNAQVVLGGAVAIDIAGASSPVTVELNENGTPSEASVNGNAYITIGNPNGEVAEAGSESVEFSGFPTSVENKVEFSESGKHITAITADKYEDGTITVTGALEYTLNGEDFEIKNVADGSSYSFTNLADGDMQLNLSGVEAKNANKPISIEELGGVDEIIPAVAADGGSIKIAGTTYEYKTASGSESGFVLAGDTVAAFVLDATGDSITLDTDSAVKVYDADDAEEIYTDDVTATGGKYTFTKTATGYELGYTFTAVGDSLEVLEDSEAEAITLSYAKGKNVYDIVEPEVEGSYKIAMTGKNEFTISGLDAEAEVTVGSATVAFENEDASVVLAATTTDSTMALEIVGLNSNGGEIQFNSGATTLFVDPDFTIDGESAFIPALALSTDVIYDPETQEIASDNVVYAIGDGEHTFEDSTYTLANNDGVVSFTLDDDGNVTAIEGLGKEATVAGDFTEVTVNGVAINTNDKDLTVTGNSKANGISAIAGLEGTITFEGTTTDTIEINGYDFAFTSTQAIVVTGDEDGIVSATGFASGDEVTVEDLAAEIKLATDGEDASITVNGVTYNVSDDKDGITIYGSGNVAGLDEDATLEVVGATGEIAVNGSTVDASEVIIGSYEGTKAYNLDPDHPIINKNTDVDEIEDILGLSYTTDQIEIVASGNADYSSETEKKKVVIGAGDQTVAFGEAGKNEVVVTEGSDGAKRLELGAKGDVVIVEDGAETTNIDVIGGAGADSIVVQDDSAVVFDMSKGGADKVMTFATSNAKVTLDSYDITSGGGIVIEESGAANIAEAINEGLIKFNDNSIVAIDRDNKGTAEITVKNKSGDPQTLINIFNYEGESEKVGFTGSDGGTLDTSKFDDDFILVGNFDGNKKASTLKAGAGDDTIYAGKGDQVNAGAGDNLVVLNGTGGAKVIISEGDTTINNLTSSDVISLSNVDSVSFDGTNLVVEGNGYTATASVEASNGFVEQLIELNGQTLKAAVAADGQNISVSGSDVPNYFVGNAGVDFSSFSGDVTYDAATKSGTVGDKDAYFSKNITSITGGAGKTSLKGSDADDVFVAGTGETSLYGGAGNNTLVGNSDQTAATEFVVLGNENGAANTIQNFQFGTDFINTDFEQNYISDVALVGNDVKLTVTKREGVTSETVLIEGAIDGGNIKVGSGGDAVAVGQFGSTAVTVDGEATYFDAVTNGATVQVSSTVTEKTNIWLANEERSGGKLFSDKFAVIDASGSVAELELAGNTAANTITAGSGNASLWGGSGSASDLLIGGSGQNSFYYELGNGNDTITNVNDGDTVNLFDTTLDNITSAEITSGGVVVQFTDGGSLTVNSNNNVNYVLKDGSTWSADHSSHTWNQKA